MYDRRVTSMFSTGDLTNLLYIILQSIRCRSQETLSCRLASLHLSSLTTRSSMQAPRLCRWPWGPTPIRSAPKASSRLPAKAPKSFFVALLIQIINERYVDSISELVDTAQVLQNINPEKPEKNRPSSALQGGESADNDADLPDSSVEAFLGLFYTRYFSTLAEPLLVRTNGKCLC